MIQQNNQTQPPRRHDDTYTLSTPYGLVMVSDSGRKVSFELHSDVRQSIHNTALYNYVQQLKRTGVTRWNVDHLHIEGRDKTLDLIRGKARLDLVYESKGRMIECELKTAREIGLEVTARQLMELVKHCERLQLLVPGGYLKDADVVLHMLNLDRKIMIVPYGYTPEDDG